jgi:hypothetical protein
VVKDVYSHLEWKGFSDVVSEIKVQFIEWN